MTDTATETAPAPEKPREPCLCGCGGTPKGRKARFLPGHDAQLKAVLYRTIRDEASTDEAEASARQKLSEFGWPEPTPKAERKRKPKAEKGDEPAADGAPVEAGDL